VILGEEEESCCGGEEEVLAILALYLLFTVSANNSHSLSFAAAFASAARGVRAQLAVYSAPCCRLSLLAPGMAISGDRARRRVSQRLRLLNRLPHP